MQKEMEFFCLRLAFACLVSVALIVPRWCASGLGSVSCKAAYVRANTFVLSCTGAVAEGLERAHHADGGEGNEHRLPGNSIIAVYGRRGCHCLVIFFRQDSATEARRCNSFVDVMIMSSFGCANVCVCVWGPALEMVGSLAYGMLLKCFSLAGSALFLVRYIGVNFGG